MRWPRLVLGIAAPDHNEMHTLGKELTFQVSSVKIRTTERIGYSTRTD